MKFAIVVSVTVAQEDVSSQELMIRASVDQGLSLSRRSYVGVS